MTNTIETAETPEAFRERSREFGATISEYGKERGTNLLLELRDQVPVTQQGGLIEYDGASYSLDRGRLARTKDGETKTYDIFSVIDGIDQQRGSDTKSERVNAIRAAAQEGRAMSEAKQSGKAQEREAVR